MIDRDKNLQRMLLNKETPEPSDVLDDKIMLGIEEVLKKNSTSHSYLYLAWIFLIFSIIVGVMISSRWINPDRTNFGLFFLKKGLVMQIICSFVILLLFERLYTITIEMKNKKVHQVSKLV